jgi:hypothetical protein
MTTLTVIGAGAIGIAACIALLYVADRIQVRWQRTVIVLVALLALLAQTVFWGHITRTLMGFDVGGSYFWLYAALVSGVAGMVWALVLLGATFLGRRLTD